jgi:hypothetical protein
MFEHGVAPVRVQHFAPPDLQRHVGVVVVLVGRHQRPFVIRRTAHRVSSDIGQQIRHPQQRSGVFRVDGQRLQGARRSSTRKKQEAAKKGDSCSRSVMSTYCLLIVSDCGSVPLCALPASSILPLCRTPATVRSTPPTGLTGPLWCWAVVWCGGWCGIHWWTGGPRRWLLRTFVARHRSVLPTRTTCLCRKKGGG